MMIRLALWLDDHIMRPLGLILWFRIETDGDGVDAPFGRMRVRGFRIGRRPVLAPPR